MNNSIDPVTKTWISQSSLNPKSTNLDLLRSVAVFCVVVNHLIRVLGYSKAPLVLRWGFEGLGHFGVLIFFIHTSLVLMMSLDRLRLSGNSLVSRFYIRRLFRIYPLSVLTVAAVLLLQIPDYFQQSFTQPAFATVVANFLLVQNLFNTPSVTGPLWSLPYEIQMYMLLPFLYMAVSRISSRWTSALAAISFGFGLWYCELRVDRLLGLRSLFEYAPWFGMGIAAYAVSRSAKPVLKSRWYAVALALFAVSPCVFHRLIGSYKAGWAGWAAGVVFALALPWFADVTSGPVRYAAQTVAKYSYGVYLWHVPILWFAFQFLEGTSWPVKVAAFGGLMMIVPAALYHLLESPMISAGGRLADRLIAESRRRRVAVYP